jgi:hypothetical protein
MYVCPDVRAYAGGVAGDCLFQDLFLNCHVHIRQYSTINQHFQAELGILDTGDTRTIDCKAHRSFRYTGLMPPFRSGYITEEDSGAALPTVADLKGSLPARGDSKATAGKIALALSRAS